MSMFYSLTDRTALVSGLKLPKARASVLSFVDSTHGGDCARLQLRYREGLGEC